MYAHLYMHFLHLFNIIFLSLLPLNCYMITINERFTLDYFERDDLIFEVCLENSKHYFKDINDSLGFLA